jgi:hypothetical protein
MNTIVPPAILPSVGSMELTFGSTTQTIITVKLFVIKTCTFIKNITMKHVSQRIFSLQKDLIQVTLQPFEKSRVML